MRLQANSNYVSNDLVMTPLELAQEICWHFRPNGNMCDPCRGEGAFWESMTTFSYRDDEPQWYEITEGRDFLSVDIPERYYDWIITNPPWSKIGDWHQIRFRAMDMWGDWFDSNNPEVKRIQQVLKLKPSDVQRQRRIGFLEKSMKTSKNVVLLMTTNHLFTKYRRAMIESYGFGIKEIAYVPWPETWNKSGFTLSANHLQFGWKGSIIETNLGGF